eukprot:5344227-Amphidinium_carterae.1
MGNCKGHESKNLTQGNFQQIRAQLQHNASQTIPKLEPRLLTQLSGNPASCAAMGSRKATLFQALKTDLSVKLIYSHFSPVYC